MDKSLRLTIISPGLQTTIQDQGREPYRPYGVPKAGPMDIGAATLANRLIGNPEFNPVLEFTLRGPLIELQGQGYLSLTGAQFEAKLDQEYLPLNQAIAIKGTHSLSLGNVQSGCRGYLAIAGSWKLQQWLGSCSTSPQNGLELTPDSCIKKGTRITVVSGDQNFPMDLQLPKPLKSAVIRILAGPEYNLLNTAVIKELLSRKFTISNQSNRMGYRLESSLANYQTPLEVISSGVVPGTIQVTHSGQLIVLMADAQTTGGYPRIANVISYDQDLLAQMKPGDQFRFRLVSLDEACQELEM